MAIKGSITLPGGIQISDAYIKISEINLREYYVPKQENGQTVYEKKYGLNYFFHYKKTQESEPFHHSREFIGELKDTSADLFSFCYKDLAQKLKLSDQEV